MKIKIDNISEIEYHFKDVDLKNWLNEVAIKHSKKIGSLQYVLCKDDFLHQINVDHLAHDDYTDIITFDYSQDKILTGEIYISMDRVVENATIHKVNFESEFCRVLVHGLLHLIGFKDKTNDEKLIMRFEEDNALKLFM